MMLPPLLCALPSIPNPWVFISLWDEKLGSTPGKPDSSGQLVPRPSSLLHRTPCCVGGPSPPRSLAWPTGSSPVPHTAVVSVSHGTATCLLGWWGLILPTLEPREPAKFRTSLEREDAVFFLLLAKHET